MQTLTEIRSLLAARGVRPKHRLGQNFLHDHNILRKLVSAALPEGTASGGTALAHGLALAPDGETIPPNGVALAPAEGTAPSVPSVLEVGPGTGALTELLLDHGLRVIACEVDRDMIEILNERVMPRAEGRLTIVEGDCLDGKHALSAALRSELDRIAPRFRLIANLPYGTATPLIATLLADHPECDGLFVTIQREVADRLLASARSDAYGPLSVTTALLARCERLMDVAPGCFWPAPTVTSAIVAIHPRAVAERAPAIRTRRALHDFERFVSRVFSKRRKQLGSILGRDTPLPTGIGAQQRPEELAPSQWLELWSLSAATGADTPCE